MISGDGGIMIRGPLTNALIKKLREEAKKRMAKSREFMAEAKKQDNYIDYVHYRTMAFDYRDYADDLEALADLYSRK